MAGNTIDKTRATRLGSKIARASVSTSKLDKATVSMTSNKKGVKMTSGELFEGRLGLMSSLRKGLTR